MNDTLKRQLLLHIQPTPMTKGHIVHSVRLDQPGQALAATGLVKVISQYPVTKLFREDRSIFLYGRCYFPDREKAGASIRTLCQHNYIVVMDLDDYPIGIPCYIDEDCYSLGCVHAIQTSTPEIADFLRERGIIQEVGVFPNQLAAPPARPEPRRGGPIRIAMAAINRQESWNAILPALNQALRALGDEVQCAVVFDRALFEELDCAQKFFHEFLSTERYLELLKRADIHVISLIDTPFNRAKSDLKFIESAAHGAVCLASPTVYGKTVRHDETGILFHHPEQLTAQLIDLARNHQRRERLRQAAYDYVLRERLLSQHIHRRYEWYCSLLDRRAEIHEALMVRRPEFSLKPV